MLEKWVRFHDTLKELKSLSILRGARARANYYFKFLDNNK